MSSRLESQTMKFAGEPSAGNLHTRFDEGRGELPTGDSLVYSTVNSLCFPIFLTRMVREYPRM